MLCSHFTWLPGKSSEAIPGEHGWLRDRLARSDIALSLRCLIFTVVDA
jgi:hypothetical protein